MHPSSAGLILPSNLGLQSRGGDSACLRVGVFSNAYHPTVSGVVNSVDLIHHELLRQGHLSDLFVPGPEAMSLWRALWESHRPRWLYQRSGGRPHLSVSSVSSSDTSPSSVSQTEGPRIRLATRSELQDSSGDRTHYFPAFRPLPGVNYAFGWPLAREPWTILRDIPLDVVHTHHPMWLGLVGRWFARKRRIPLVFTFHTQYDHYLHYLMLPDWMTRPGLRWRVQSFTDSCQLIIAPSQLISDYLQEFRVRCRVEILANAIDLSAFQRGRYDSNHCLELRQRLGLRPDTRVALYAGRLGKEKNLEFLLRSFAQSSKDLYQRHLLVVGEGLELPSLRQLARELSIEEQVTFTGRVDYAQMPLYYASSDFFAMSSVTEVKPLVVLEALAAGLPVLAVAACGTADTISHLHDGWLCGESLEEHAALFSRAFDSDLSSLSRAAVSTAQNFSIVNYVEKLTQLYQEERERMKKEDR